MVISKANPQTTISFTPIDRDLIRTGKFEGNIEKSLILVFLSVMQSTL